MSNSISLGGSVSGSAEIQKALAEVPEKIRFRLRKKLDSIGSRVASDVRSNLGQFKTRTGKLAGGLYHSASSRGSRVTMRVGIRSDVFFAPWLEFGTTPKDVHARGGMIRRGGRRGSGVRKNWHIRPHPFLLPAWQAMAGEIQSEVETSLEETAREFNGS